MIFDTTLCEERIGYTFKDKMLLRQCFTHSSYAHEHGEKDNELLEFFGDSIIEYAVTEYLFKNSYGDEGKLTHKRAEIVSKEPLLKAVYKLKITEFMLLGHGQTLNAKPDEKMFASLYEAVVAGIYIDGGMAAAKKFIKNTIIKDFEEKQNFEKTKNKRKNDNKDGKSAFQEYVQKRKLGSVSYETLAKNGPDHLPEFRVAALLNGQRIAEGKGASKRLAEMQAAKKALDKLNKQGGKKQ